MSMATDGFPTIDTNLFDQFIETYGFNVRLRKKPSIDDRDCPCYDPYVKVANPDCPYCEGSGSTEGFVDQIVRGFILFKAPRGNWGIGDQHTMTGHLERIQVVGFFEGRVDIQMDDHVLLNMASPTTARWFAFRVDALMPRLVGDSSGHFINMFNRVDLRHVEYPFAGGI
jgi:hypothetical protein